MNKRILSSVAFIVVSNFCIANYASANYEHRHNFKHSYKFDNSKNRYLDGRSTSKNHSDNRSYNDKKYQKHHPVSRCFIYRVTVAGGRGGFRFQHDKDDFKRINDSDYTGRVCGHTDVSFELSKIEPSTYVAIEINGQHFKYQPNSKADKYINHWHRKYFSVNLKYRYD